MFIHTLFHLYSSVGWKLYTTLLVFNDLSRLQCAPLTYQSLILTGNFIFLLYQVRTLGQLYSIYCCLDSCGVLCILTLCIFKISQGNIISVLYNWCSFWFTYKFPFFFSSFFISGVALGIIFPSVFSSVQIG